MAHIAPNRIKNLVDPPVTVVPAPEGILVEHDVPVPMRDGTILRVNVHRPAAPGPHPVIMCLHPYGKDEVPHRHRLRPPSVNFQYRIILQAAPVTISELCTWEAPDPATWVPKGYVVVNADARGWHASEGEPSLLSPQEGEDYHDLIEWAGAAEWSTGRVGLMGVSYLAMSQWRVAALRPPSLAAICPWEGHTDPYRDFVRPGGVRERGFSRIWTHLLRRESHGRMDWAHEMGARPLDDEWWRGLVAPLEQVEAPALVCGSFSDQSLHTRGSFEGFRRISSPRKWLYTHRGGKWSTFYSEEAVVFQERFLDRFLKGVENGMDEVPPVRLEVHDTRHRISSVRAEPAFPPPSVRWTTLAPAADGSLSDAAAPLGTRFVAFPEDVASFAWTAPRDLEVVGPMRLRLRVSSPDAEDLIVVAVVRKLRDGEEIGFEGSYGIPFEPVTRGMLRVSQRRVGDGPAPEHVAWHPHDVREPLEPDEAVDLDIEMLPSATAMRAGDVLRLDVGGRWPYSADPLRGSFPSAYEESPRGTCVLHLGGGASTLEVPIIG
jgi:predicted acyl esterase